MKAVIFAGGVGTRLWPLSRKKSPKQFEKIVGDKSTLQLTVERLFPDFAPEDIYIATGKGYTDVVSTQLPMIPEKNIIGEPSMRDNGPAVSFMMGYIAKQNPDEAVVILWSDHLVKYENKFKHILKIIGELVEREKKKIVFIGQKPRFASENLGWIETGKEMKNEDDVSFRSFEGFKYRPTKEAAQTYFEDEKYCWNLGYFVSTAGFVYELFKQFSPGIYFLTEKILEKRNSPEFAQHFEEYYQQMPKVNFDNAVLEHLDNSYANVVVEDIGWSDVGAWEALKEALEQNNVDNIIRGKVLMEHSNDNLVYNYEDKKLIVGVDLNDILVVNTDDVLLVARKSSVSKIKQLVEQFKGTENEDLT